MFQNTGAGAVSMPSTFLRMTRAQIPLPERNVRHDLRPRAPAPPRRSPSAWPGSVSRAKSSRSFSISASHGQPNIALSQADVHEAGEDRIGDVGRHPGGQEGVPAAGAGGSFLARRATSVCQSIDCMSTLKPAFSISDLATGARLVSIGRSVECMSTIGVPS